MTKMVATTVALQLIGQRPLAGAEHVGAHRM